MSTRTGFDDKCNCCQSVNTWREQDGRGWQIYCRDCGKGEVFIDFSEFENTPTALESRIENIGHSEARRDIITTRWFK
jgi:hypothetical protein